jgi:hypothetical protein
VLRKIFEAKREKDRKLHNEKLHNFYSSPSIVRMTKSNRTRWGEHVAHIGRNVQNLSANLK